MKKLKVKAPGFVVNGTIGGHPFLSHKNHASGGALVNVPIGMKFSAVGAKKLNAQRPAIKAGTMKG